MEFKVAGKRVVKSTGKRDVISAKAVELNTLEAIQTKTWGKSTTLLLSDAIDRCFEERWSATKMGVETHERALNLLKYLEDKPLNAITNTDVQKLKTKLETEGKSPATVNRHMTRLKTVLIMGHQRWQVVDSMPFIPMSKEKTGRIRFLSKKEETDLLETLDRWDEHDASAFFALLVDTGLRLSEGLNLKRDEVNFSKNLITVSETKNDTPRSIPMTQRVRVILMQRKDKGVFFSTLSFNRIEYLFSKAKASLGIEDDDFVIHALRHTFASRLVQAGYDLYKVKMLLGHSSIKMTERYAHLLPSNVMDAAKVLENCQWDV